MSCKDYDKRFGARGQRWGRTNPRWFITIKQFPFFIRCPRIDTYKPTTGLLPWFRSSILLKVKPTFKRPHITDHRLDLEEIVKGPAGNFKINGSASRHARTGRNAGSGMCLVEGRTLKETDPNNWCVLSFSPYFLFKHPFVYVTYILSLYFCKRSTFGAKTLHGNLCSYHVT